MQEKLYQVSYLPDTANASFGSRLFYCRLTKEQLIQLCNRVLDQFLNNYELFEVFYSRELRLTNLDDQTQVRLKGACYSAIIDNLRNLIERAENDELEPIPEVTKYGNLPLIINLELQFALLFNDGNPLEQTVEVMENFKELSIVPTCYDYI